MLSRTDATVDHEALSTPYLTALDIELLLGTL